MYEKRFGLHRKPFQSVLTDLEFFQSETLHEILPAVLHALKSDLGVAVLTGPSGAGKSVTLEHLRRSLESSCQTVLIRGGTVHSAADLLFLLQRKLLKCQTQDAETNSTAASSTAASNVVRRWEVVERLERIVSFWGPLIVLLDDAHLVQPEVFAELRALLEEDFAGQKLLRLLIAGPLLLEEVLAEPNRVDFVQKIRTHVFLQPLRSSEAVAYLNHQLTSAGALLTDVMDGAAVERIVVAADGIPRCLNLLADESLMVCDENEADRVTRQIVDQALGRLQHLPYAWNVSLQETHEDDSMEMDDPDPMPGADISATNGGVTEVGVFEIGESASPTQSPNSRATPTVPAPQNLLHAVTMEGSVGCIEIGAPPEPQAAQPSAESQSSVSVHNVSVDSEAVTDMEETWTDGLSVVSESDLNTDVNDALPPQTDQTIDASDSTWTATEVTAEEFFQHQETLADFDDSDDAIAWKSSGELPLVDQTAFSADAIDQPQLFEDQNDEADDLAPTADSMSDRQPGFESFQPWQPAGTWPAATMTRPVAIAAEPTAANILPVFDRYTWCELGRSVSHSAWSRQHISLPLMTFAQWPPLTHGIAPADRVPVVDLQDDYAELLTDLRMLIDATSDNDSQTPAAAAATDDLFLPGSDHAASDSRETSTRDYDRNPETALDRIQQLLECERSASDQPPTASSAQPQPPASAAQEALSESSGTELQTELQEDAAEGDLLSFAASDADSRGWSLVDDSQDQPAPEPLSFLNEIFDAAQRPHPSTFDAGEFIPEGPSESDDTAPPLAPRNSVGSRNDVSHDDPYPLHLNRVICDDDRDVSLLDESQIQHEDEQTQQQQYLPQLLRQARQRVASRSVHGGQLRHAAGAESISATSNSQEAEAASPKPRLSISSVQDEEEEPQSASETAETATSALIFTNLFTRLRLRQRDKRA